jgi:hypothetical protein
MKHPSSFRAVAATGLLTVLMFLSGAGVAHAKTSPPTDPNSPPAASQGTTIYPPTNQAAGSGLIYFPQGGNASLYAVPVNNDPNLINGINNQATATATGDAAIATALGNLSLSQGLSGRVQVSCIQGSYITSATNTGGNGSTLTTPQTQTCFATDTQSGLTFMTTIGGADTALPNRWTQVTTSLPINLNAECTASTGQRYLQGQQALATGLITLPAGVGPSSGGNVAFTCAWTCSAGSAWASPGFANGPGKMSGNGGISLYYNFAVSDAAGNGIMDSAELSTTPATTCPQP